jgi:membrane protease YdiL (CAAX protease family)
MAWGLILVTLLGSSLIRQLHEFIPDWTPLPWPVRSPLYALLVVFFLLLLATPVASRRLPLARRERVLTGALAPLLVAVVYEKVLSVTLYEALLTHAVRFRAVRDHLDSWIHILIGLGMTTAVLLLLPLMRTVGLGSFASPKRLRSGFYLHFLALAATYLVLAGLFAVIEGGASPPILLFPVGGTALMLAIGQTTRALAEEFYYRGLLQQELTGLMAALGVRSRRSGQALAIGLISLGFGIEHFRFGAPLAESYAGFAYAVAAGFLFGYLLVLTGNVFFCGLVHATNNLVSAGLMPRLSSPDGSLVVPSEPFLYLYLIAVFLVVFVVLALSRGTLRSIFLPEAKPPLGASG